MKYISTLLLVLTVTCCFAQTANDSLARVGEVFRVVEDMPRFPGCEEITGTAQDHRNCWQKKMREFIHSNMNYPNDAREEGIEGTVVINFIINKDGSISEAKSVRALHDSLEAEGLRIVSMMPNWVAGMQRENLVRVSFNLPIKFKL